METTQTSINLARRLRPQKFSQIIGQEIPVRMLKNSLYMNKFFPVYLFAGQRGCGKTSTARVFAAAVNCDQFLTFQQNPAQADIPCLTCPSCLAMQRSAHPDFIEIDAASNTGVDNVRQLIETAAYVPLQGRKKVYLIDEAHMLSKAAFNALLKILEEPPVSVLFMLATTELHKIPQTVLSRCFQLSFPALEQQAFTGYLQEVCRQEKIDIEDTALAILIEETDGSARDALNLLEQVRFLESPVTEASIRKTLGKLSIAVLLDILEAIVNNAPATIISLLQQGSLQGTNPQATWDLFVNAVKTLLWLKYTPILVANEFLQYQTRFEHLAAACSHNRLLAIMQLLWDQEHIFLQTSKKAAFLEFLFLQLAEQDNIASIDELLLGLTSGKMVGTTMRAVENRSETLRDGSNQLSQRTRSGDEQLPHVVIPASEPGPSPTSLSSNRTGSQPSLGRREDDNLDGENKTETLSTTQTPPATPEWIGFLAALRTHATDAIMLAILEQATCTRTGDNELTVLLRHNSKFFTDKLDEMKSTWLPLLQEAFGGTPAITFGQLPASAIPAPAPKQQTTPLSKNIVTPASEPGSPRPRPTQPVTQGGGKQYRSFSGAKQDAPMQFEGEFVPPTTPFASLLVSHFPGKLKRLKNFN